MNINSPTKAIPKLHPTPTPLEPRSCVRRRSSVKKHVLGSLKQHSFCPATLLVKGVATKVPTKMSSASSASHLHILWCASQCPSPARKPVNLAKACCARKNALGEAECCILRLAEGQDQPKLRKPKLDQRVRNERHTQDSDDGPQMTTTPQSTGDERKTSWWKLRHGRRGLLQTFQGVSIVAVSFQHVCQADLVSQSITVQAQRQSGREHYQHEVQLRPVTALALSNLPKADKLVGLHCAGHLAPW